MTGGSASRSAPMMSEGSRYGDLGAPGTRSPIVAPSPVAGARAGLAIFNIALARTDWTKVLANDRPLARVPLDQTLEKAQQSGNYGGVVAALGSIDASKRQAVEHTRGTTRVHRAIERAYFAQYWLLPATLVSVPDKASNPRLHLAEVRVRLHNMMAAANFGARERHVLFEAAHVIARLDESLGRFRKGLPAWCPVPGANARDFYPLCQVKAFQSAVHCAGNIATRSSRPLDTHHLFHGLAYFLDAYDAVSNWGYMVGGQSVNRLESWWMDSGFANNDDWRSLDHRCLLYSALNVFVDQHCAEDTPQPLTDFLQFIAAYPEIALREQIYGHAELSYWDWVRPRLYQRSVDAQSLQHVGTLLSAYSGGDAAARLQQLAALGRMWHAYEYGAYEYFGTAVRPADRRPRVRPSTVAQFTAWSGRSALDALDGLEDAEDIALHIRALRRAVSEWPELGSQRLSQVSRFAPDDDFACAALHELVLLAGKAL